MPTPVSPASTSFSLPGVRTAQPVVSAGLSRWSEELSFLLGYDLHHAGGGHIPQRPSGRTSLLGLAYAVRVPYCRSPGARVVRVTVQLHQSDDSDTQTVNVALPFGALWIDAQGLDGSTSFPNPPLGRASTAELAGWVNVSGVSETDLDQSFGFECTPSGSKAVGIRRCAVVEVPRASLNPIASEPVYDAASTRPGRLVVDGGPGVAVGGERVFYELDRARSEMREHLCIAGVESDDANGASTTPHWHREASTYGVIDWIAPTGTSDPAWYLETRRLYRGNVPTTWRFVVRYRAPNVDCGIKLYAEGGSIVSHVWVGAGAAVAQELPLPASSGSWAWASMDVDLPGDGDTGLVRITLKAKGPGTGLLLSLATVGFIEREP